jgi:hypothetical protein
LCKDLLLVDSVRCPVQIDKLLKALAFQVESEISYNEIEQTIGTNNKTIEKHIDLLKNALRFSA